MIKEKQRLWYERNKTRVLERVKQYAQNNKEDVEIYQKEYRDLNREKAKKYSQNYREKNKNKILELRNRYNEEHKEQIKEHKRQFYQKNKKALNEQYVQKKQKDPHLKLACNLRSRLYVALKNDWKSGSAVADLMMSISDFKIYLEEKFYPNPKTGEIMSWGNYGKFGWHIDHIVPLSAFDLTVREELLKAVHFSNLRPMWAERNWSENDRGMSRNRIKHIKT